MQRTTAQLRMPGTPKPWMNAAMRTALRTPLLRRIMGGLFAVLTVQGAKSGRRYAIPVQYFTLDDRFVVLSQRTRRWWRNLAARPQVLFLVRGRTMRCRAVIADDDEAVSTLTECLRQNPKTARFYGLDVSSADDVERDVVDALLDHVVVILITGA